MAKIAFLLLCHKDPVAIVRQARGLVAAGDYVAIHFDARAPAEDFAQITQGVAEEPNILVCDKRVKGGWGQWSLVQATLNTARAAERTFPQASHFYMLSGDCRPIKSAEHAHAVLDARDVDYIESVDFFASDWIKTGMKEDRLFYRHLVNEREHKALFYRLLDWQKRLGLSRQPPADINVMIGSQWWCLRRATLQSVLAFCAARRDVLRFFSTTWIPDETFFQTLVRHLVPRDQIDSRTQTFLMFTDYGMPATFHDDHYDLLLGQDYLFARKISPEAATLRDRLETLWTSGRRDLPDVGDGRKVIAYLTARGRAGRRFARRAWEAQAKLDRGQELIVLVSKRHGVARRLAQRLREERVLPALGYIFEEPEADLPDLGGVATTLDKRNRHRRAFLRLLFHRLATNRLAICLDPALFGLLQDAHGSDATVKTLILDSAPTAEELRAQAEAMGLAGPDTPDATLDQTLPVLARDLAQETRRIREADLPHVHTLRAEDPVHEAAATLFNVFGCDPRIAMALAQTPNLFDD
ncbi:beta-1,6-N-acetylglucosaminyltransferase [Jannaschia sp. M317]|uniref:beta-1,6-N-acetylglucosaminyltransferase n=1 Tax=Jannaschia sp. M317 TaxID=2867011 RepID=UPI0021A2E812|nr:beta-1,6-N-acetylglucosaminyltransferase [Jannaschia sp. M317]UWQ18548.1 beta-1,6-N-acetylglucosaminyltransferase [Jannaschia sp. M317]